MWEEGFSKMKGCNLLSYYLLSPKLHSNDSCKMRIVTTSFVISKLVGSFSVSKARIFVYAIHLQWKQFVEKLELRIYTWKNALKRENQQNCALKKARKERGLKYRKILLNNFSVGQGSFSLIHHSFISPWGARKNRDYLACFSIESTLKMYQGIRIKLQFRDHIVVQRWIFQNNWIIKFTNLGNTNFDPLLCLEINVSTSASI